MSAQLAALRAQVNPHFLFNSLNSIAQLIATDPAKAEACVERLGDIYRYLLHRAHADFVPLAEELSVAESYLEIERARFGDALTVEEKHRRAGPRPAAAEPDPAAAGRERGQARHLAARSAAGG